jgi:hypothetical protein
MYFCLSVALQNKYINLMDIHLIAEITRLSPAEIDKT